MDYFCAEYTVCVSVMCVVVGVYINTAAAVYVSGRHIGLETNQPHWKRNIEAVK